MAELSLGPITEARLSHAFANGLLLTAKATAELLSIDTKTLSRMTACGLISCVAVGGSSRRYSEANVRQFLQREWIEGELEVAARTRARSSAVSPSPRDAPAFTSLKPSKKTPLPGVRPRPAKQR